MENKVNIPEYAKVKVYWDDIPENYSRQSKINVRNYFSDKYGVSKNNIEVIYRPVKIGDSGEVIEITGAGVDNILDRNYQVELMKEWCKRENKDVNLKRLFDLDKKVNGSLDVDSDIKSHRSWKLKWVFVDNFLCFGAKNFVSLSGLNGLNVVNSLPSNQGGKTTFSVDVITFLLFGKTTKTDKNEQIFNTFTDKNETVVRGMLEIEGEEKIIERVLTRKAKRVGGWNVTNKVNYYKILPDGEEELENEEDAKKTGQKIQDNVGSENDFNTTILSTGRNLEDLVDAKPTESGRLLNKFIGLEVIEAKEVIAKKMYSDFNKSKKGNLYYTTSLLSDNEDLKEKIQLGTKELDANKETLDDITKEISRLENEKDRLINSKPKVDVVISQLNPETLESDVKIITEKGINFKKKITDLETKISKLKDISYDEFKFNKLEKDSRSLNIEIGGLKNDITNFGKVIENLKSSEVCQACDRPLEGVDNSKKVKGYEDKINETKKNIVDKTNLLIKIDDSIVKIKKNSDLVNERNRLELERDKAEVEIGSLRNKIVSKKTDLKSYKDNESAIKTNISIDSDISAVKTTLVVKNNAKLNTNQKIFQIERDIKDWKIQIEKNDAIVITLKKEEGIEKIFKVYLEMIGKKGISKLVLRSVLPIINSELARLLDGVCDFEVELEINIRNEVQFILIKNEVIKSLKSGSGLERTIASLGLRCVLSKISHLPTPNFITFDEVLGKVSAENLEKMEPMFGKIKDMFDIVFLITHNDIVKDWGDNVITVIKEKDVSRLQLK